MAPPILVAARPEHVVEAPLLEVTQQPVFHPEPGIDASYLFHIEDKKLPLYMVIEGLELKMIYKEAPKVDVEITVSKERLSSLVKGSGTFQRAFMAGEMSIKGDFNALRELDKLFIFS